MNNFPIAVLISDVHYSLSTLRLADAAMNQAIDKANELFVPLVVAGDLHDTKANLRGECIAAMVKTFKRCNVPALVLIGNHDKINEKSEEHALEFLRPYVTIIDKPMKNLLPYWQLIPYQHDLTVLKTYLSQLPRDSRVIMHQGFTSSHSGEYIQDKTALSSSDIVNLRVISGHYHRRQTIKTNEFTWDYIGNPYTLNFAEAEDPEKGYQVLYEDNGLQFVPTNLRRHLIVDIAHDMVDRWMGKMIADKTSSEDLLWLKITGPYSELTKWTRQRVSSALDLNRPFKLDAIPLSVETQKHSQDMKKPQSDILDSLIDSMTNTDDASKNRLKCLWKSLV